MHSDLTPSSSWRAEWDSNPRFQAQLEAQSPAVSDSETETRTQTLSTSTSAHPSLPEPASTGQVGVPAAAVAVESAPPATAAHPHHYICEPANGPTSVGVCKFCGKTRKFSNSEAEWSYSDKGKSRKGGAATPAQLAEFYGMVEPTSIARWIA